MRKITAIRNARLRGNQGLVDIAISNEGDIASIGPAAGMDEAPESLNADGRLVVPAFVDSHLHLDLAYSLDLVPPNESGTLLEAIRLWAEAKKQITAENVRQRAIRAIHDEVSHGTGFIRTHVDVGTAAGLRLVEGVLAAREAARHLVDIEVVVFPQDGILQDPGAEDLMREAMRMGCDVIGGIAHNERTAGDSQAHIDRLFAMAEEFDAPIDCHIDETDAPESRCTEYLAAKAIERRMAGRVAASHVCALASYSDVHAHKVIGLLVRGRVHVICNPGVNLHLQGRFDRYPKRRGLTRVSELTAAGVNVSAGQDCIKDPFYPLGTGNMLEVGHMLIHADHLSAPRQIEWVADAITVNPAKAMGLQRYGAQAGCLADLAVLDADSVHEALRTRKRPAFVVKRGNLIEAGDVAPAC